MKNQSLTVFIFLLFCFLPDVEGQRRLSGKITDEQGTPLIGALVQFKAGPTGTITDLDGQFELSVPADTAARILVRYLGYQTQEIGIGQEERLEIWMTTETSELEEVVVVGYGTQSRRQVTSAIEKAGPEIFEGVPATTVDDALQGRLPGVVLSRASGALGAASIVRVRGVGSVNAGNQPLIVIDGLIFEGLSGSGLGSSGTNPLLNLNPADIESIEVLKDGAASAIYGSRGANGVIIVTTKRGKLNTAPQVNLSYYAGFSEPTTAFDLLDGNEYAVLWNQAVRNVGLDESSGLILDEDNQPTTNWFDLMTGTAFQQEVNLNVSGGGGTTRYYIGGSYRDEDGYYLNTNLKRYSFRANIDQMVSSRVQAGLSINPSLVIMDRAFEGRSLHAPNTWAFAQPNVEAYDEKGELIDPLILPPRNFPGINPLVNFLETNAGLTIAQVLTAAYLEYRPWHFLKVRGEFSAEYTHSEDMLRLSSRTFGNVPVNGTGISTSRRILNYNATGMIAYERIFGGDHYLELTAGANFTKRTINGLILSGNNFADDRLLYLHAAANIDNGSSGRTDAAFSGFFARADYRFAGRYLLTLSARYDGSSRFGKDNRYGFFPALSAGWIISEENFFPANPLNFLKLKGSIGLSGNGDVEDFASLGKVSVSSYAGEPAFLFDQLENQDLRWETSLHFNAGVDFGLWNNRMTGSLEYFVKNTNDLLLDVPLPGTTGILTSFQNTGRLRNQGFEFDLSAGLFTGTFRWNLSLNGATLHNEILELPDQNGDGIDDEIVRFIWIYRTGRPVASWYLAPFAGVDPQNGDALFYDHNSNTVPVNPSLADRVIAGSSFPTFTGGLTNTFGWNQFDLSVFFQFSRGQHLYRDEGATLEDNMTQGLNQLRTQLQAWTPENPDTQVPQARFNSPNGLGPSTRYLDNADYLRMKNIQLGYTFNGLGKRNGQLRLYAAAQNLLTFTGYDGLDPEADNVAPEASVSGAPFFSSPQNKTFLFGLNYQL